MKRVIVFVVLLAVVLASGGYAVAQAREPEASYSTAKATRADVARTLDLSGTVTATGRRDLAFGTDGTVARVSVKAGQRVRKGHLLARLETTALDAAVTEAEATLARAKAQLESDEDAQAAAVSEAASTPSGANTPQKPRSSTPSGPSNPTAPTKPDPALQQALALLATQQKAVTTAQSSAAEAITAAKAALASQSQTCQAATDADDPEGEDAGLPAACSTALAAVQDAQDTVADRQDKLQAALTALSETLSKAVGAVTTSSQSGGQGQPQGQPQGQSQGGPAASVSTVSPSSSSDGSADNGDDGGGVSGGTVTAARLAQDQADIDTADARLDEARAARRLATLRAPYAGRVLQVDLARGDQVSSSDTAAVLVGKGVTTVAVSVTNAQVPDVRRGQAVTVTPAGWTTSMRGTVSEIGLLPDSSGSFPVTVTVQSPRTVAEGSTASVSIVTGVARDAVTVPTSAITRTGTRAVVSVLDGETVNRTVVTVGVVGKRRASISKGLKAGATVVLADLAAEVPSSDTSGPQRFRSGPPGGGELGGGGPTVTFKR